MKLSSVGVAALLPAAAASCIDPVGIGDGGIDFDSLNLPRFDDPLGVYGNAIVRGGLQAIAPYETPVQARLVLRVVTAVYNAAAAFEPQALDMLGRVEESEDRRRCVLEDTLLFAQHRQLTLAYAVLWISSEVFGPSSGAFSNLADEWNMDLSICDVEDCSDIATPWGLARQLVDDSNDIFSRDGWNADGSLDAQFNRIPYSDWRDDPYKPSSQCEECWSPLLETNKLGFLYRQEHVTPHIGFTAKSFFVGDAKICSRKLSDPKYNYDEEIDLLLERSAQLTDVQKAEIEFFDSKFTSLVPLSVQYFNRQGFSLDSFEFILYDAATIGVVYESVLQAWRVKVQTDKIRPTTLIHRRKAGETVIAYQGPSEGTVGPILGEEWQPYLRVMPHAEYPSGSSCICKAFAQASIRFIGDDIVEGLGGPLVQEIPQGSSFVEPGLTPSTDLALEYSTWTEIADRCGLSRLEGGMHFIASVPDGEELCVGIGNDLYEYFSDLAIGVVPEYTADLLAVPEQERFCDGDDDEDDSSEDESDSSSSDD